jgi:uncharacterized protein
VRLSLVPRTSEFYDLFARAGANALEVARLAERRFLEYPSGSVSQADVKAAETAGDEITHDLIQLLNTQYITPFDREDIYELSSALDDVVDLIDDAARAMVIYNVRESTDYARRFGDVIQRMAVQLHEVVSTLERPAGIAPRLVEMHRLENEGDDLYHAAIAALFRDTADPLTVIKWKEIYEKLEAAVDRCESVAHIIESVIIKHA